MTQRTLNAVIVCLLAMLLAGCNDDTTTTSVQVTINDPGVTNLQVGDSLTLSVNVTGDPNNRVTWTASDASLASVSPTGFVEARAPGTVRITATSVLDAEQRDTVTFTITGSTPPDDPPPNPDENQPPQVEAGSSLTGEVGSPITISANASDPDGDALSFAWNVSRPEGSDAALEETGDTVTFTPDVAGTYSLELTVRDGEGGAATATWTVVTDVNETNLLCEAQGYACSITDVSDDILARSDALLADAKSRVNAGQSNEQVRTWLAQQEGMLHAEATEGAVVFMLENGSPTWLITPDATTPRATTLDTTGFSRQQNALPASTKDIVGEGTDRDNDNRQKQALILSPFKFEFQSNDPGRQIATLLQRYPDYQATDGVTLLENAGSEPQLAGNPTAGNITVDAFANWDEYDVIVVHTHGSELGADSFSCSVFSGDIFCAAGVTTGERVASCSEAKARYADAGYLGVRCASVSSSAVSGNYVLLDSDFFASTYSRFSAGLGNSAGLDKAVVYLSGCQTFSNSSLAFNLGGNTSSYFGWDESVLISEMGNPGLQLFRWMLNDGITTEEAFDRLQEAGLDETTKADLELYSNGGLRIREVVSLRQPTGNSSAQLQDGTVLPASVIAGTVGDGRPDTLTLRALVEGATDSGDISTSAAGIDALDGFVLRFLVNDQMVGVPLALGQSTPDEVVIEPYDDPNSEREGYLVTYQDIALDADASTFSVSADELRFASLGASLQLPEGGESRFEVEDICVGCGVWTVEQDDPIELGEGYNFTRAISSAANYQTAASRRYVVSIPGVGALPRLELTGENFEGNVNAVKQTWTLAPNFPHFIDVVFDSPQTLDGQYVTCAYSLFGQQTGNLTLTDEVVAEGVNGTVSLEGGFAGELSLYGDTNGNGTCEFADIQIDTDIAQSPVAAPGVNFFITFEGATVE